MNAKLYKVRVSQFDGSFSMVTISNWWISAVSRKQAIDKCLSACYLNVPKDRIHVHVDNFPGGRCHIGTTFLTPTGS